MARLRSSLTPQYLLTITHLLPPRDDDDLQPRLAAEGLLVQGEDGRSSLVHCSAGADQHNGPVLLPYESHIFNALFPRWHLREGRYAWDARHEDIFLVDHRIDVGQIAHGAFLSDEELR